MRDVFLSTRHGAHVLTHYSILVDVGMPPSPLPPPAPAAAPNLPAIAPAPAPAAADADADALEPAPPPPALPQLQVNPEAQDEVDYASGSGGVGLESGARGGGGAAAARDASDDDDDGNKSGEEGQERSEEGLKEKARGRPGRLPGRVIGPRVSPVFSLASPLADIAGFSLEEHEAKIDSLQYVEDASARAQAYRDIVKHSSERCAVPPLLRATAVLTPCFHQAKELSIKTDAYVFLCVGQCVLLAFRRPNFS